MLAALAAPADAELRARLGPERHERLQTLLREHTEAACSGFGRVRSARSFDDLPALLAGHTGPVVLVAPDVPRLGEHHIAAALADLADGAMAAFAPAMDGKPFLLAFPDASRLDLLAQGIDGLAAASQAAGGVVGMVRPERRLAAVGDARAYAADPLTPGGLRELAAAAR